MEENMSTPSIIARYPGTHISQGASIHESCRIDPGTHISAEAILDQAVVIYQNVKIIGRVHLERAVKVQEHVTLVGPLVIGQESYIARGAVIGVERAEGVSLQAETRLGQNCQIGLGAVILAGVQVGSHARIRAGSWLIGDLPQYGLASRNPAILERYACPICGGPLDSVRSLHQVHDTRCWQCKGEIYRFCISACAGDFNRILLPGNNFGERVNTTGDDPRWRNEKELG
jgi:acetyltransferase-like isoleucine patch superfamily enzyme